MSIPILPIEERTFAAVFRRMKVARAAMPADPLAGFRKRRTSDAAIAGYNLPPLPPLSPVEILKPLSVATIDSIDDDGEPETPLEPELLAEPTIAEAGEESPEDSPEESEESGESDIDHADVEHGEEEPHGAETEL
jgi:hypothetical protein